MEFIKSTKNGSIFTKNNITYKASDSFLQIVGYKEYEIVNKSLKELSILLKMNFQMNFEDIKDVENLYIFNKEDVPKNVTITCESQNNKDEKIYHIKENINHTLDVLLENFAKDDIKNEEGQAIYTYPDLICLKSNKQYINSFDFMSIKYDNLIGFYHPNPKHLSKIVETGYFHENNMEYINSNGTSSYWDANIRLIYDSRKNMFLISTLYNVTDKVLEKKALDKERLEMEIILDNISDPIDKVNKRGEFTYIHKIAKDKLSSYTQDVASLNDKQRYKFFKYSDIDGNEISFKDTPIQRVLRGETITNEIIIETNLPNVNNDLPTSYYECNGVPIYDNLGNIDGGILIYKDVRHIIKLNEYYTLRENIEGLFLRYALISYDNFKVKYINEKAMNMIKDHNPHINSENEVVGNNFFDYYHLVDGDPDDLIKEIKKSIERKELYSIKQKIIDQGKSRYIKTIFHPTYDEEYRVDKIEIVDVDVTDEMINNQLISKSLKIQDEMFINISHELKTPLNLIFSASQLLNMYLDKDLPGDFKEDMVYSNEIIMQNCYRLSKLINNILDISNIESGFFQLNLRNNNIVDSIGNIVKSISECNKANGIKIKFKTNLEKLIIALDIDKIERVLLNLISNSIKFSRGKVLILVTLEDKGEYAEISVEDNGIGMRQEDLHMIFEKYRKVDTSLSRISEGNGIGLSLAKSIVELHGGQINVESSLGVGSIFKIKLPIISLDNENIDFHEDDNNKADLINLELSDIYS